MQYSVLIVVVLMLAIDRWSAFLFLVGGDSVIACAEVGDAEVRLVWDNTGVLNNNIILANE